MREKLKKFSESCKAARARMIKRLERPVAVLKKIFGWSVMLTLFVGGASFFAFILAIAVGGELAVSITAFIKQYIIPGVTYASTVTVLYGIIVMYLSGQTALSAKKSDGAPKADKKPEADKA